MNTVSIQPVDFGDAVRAEAYLDLLDHYMRGPTGSGTPLSPALRTRLTPELRQRPTVLCFVAYLDDTPAGLLTCVEGFSTFAGRPLLNIHDIVVHERFRRRGLARALLEKAEDVARTRGCCKLTLEVLEGNAGARQAYLEFGFRAYELDPAMGRALFMEKRLEG
ncbi:MAG TPA: GNAT family N-acetyltransferase [Rhodocyclaceae bacterium]|nr:GNAT family N-acetyltransferase [Rhodocyclaceae bacterium]